jgi:phospholipid/cholesterol/gamma-HCH transport system permease protein
MKKNTTQSEARIDVEQSNSHLVLSFSGVLDSSAVSSLWPVAHHAFQHKDIESITVCGSDVDYCDGAGTALFVYVRQMAERLNASLAFQDLEPDILNMLDLYPADRLEASDTTSAESPGFIEDIGRTAFNNVIGLKEHVSFMGELTVGLVKTLIRPAGLRMKDFFTVVEASGAKALPIIGMLGFLVGLILAFQGAVLMAQFGAEIYIADFVGKSVVRELGPLITAIIVAGRTGSAFAAEIGTMKVNEEIDALSTMGLDPVRFLVVPRVLGATLMTPLLAVLTNLFGMAGGAIVMKGLGFPLITYVNRVLAAVTAADYMGGLFKSLVFGLLISGAGCLCGLRTGEEAQAPWVIRQPGRWSARSS